MKGDEQLLTNDVDASRGIVAFGLFMAVALFAVVVFYVPVAVDLLSIGVSITPLAVAIALILLLLGVFIYYNRFK